MKLKNIPETAWGAWHEGMNCAIRVQHNTNDTYPRDFYVAVQIMDFDGHIHTRRGHGKFIGNFAPIWVNWKGKKHQVETLLREGL